MLVQPAAPLRSLILLDPVTVVAPPVVPSCRMWATKTRPAAPEAWQVYVHAPPASVAPVPALTKLGAAIYAETANGSDINSSLVLPFALRTYTESWQVAAPLCHGPLLSVN